MKSAMHLGKWISPQNMLQRSKNS